MVRSLSLSLSLSRSLARSRGFVFVFQVASRPFSSPRGETFSHRRRRRVNRNRGVSSGDVDFCRSARRRRRRRRRRLHSARTSVPRRRAEVLRIERGFAFGGRAALGSSKKDLVSFRFVSLFFYLGVTFF